MSDIRTTTPVAKVVPVELEKHGHVRIDDYYWLNEPDNPDVIAYLEAENAYRVCIRWMMLALPFHIDYTETRTETITFCAPVL